MRWLLKKWGGELCMYGKTGWYFCAGEGAGVARIWEGKVGCYVCIVRRACGSY